MPSMRQADCLVEAGNGDSRMVAIFVVTIGRELLSDERDRVGEKRDAWQGLLTCGTLMGLIGPGDLLLCSKLSIDRPV